MTDTLKQDLARIATEELPALREAVQNPDQAAPGVAIVDHLINTLWPVIGQLVEEIQEIDGAVEDLAAEEEDILQPETHEAIGKVLVLAPVITAELKKRLNATKEPKTMKMVLDFEEAVKDAAERFQDIYVPNTEPDGEGGEEGEDTKTEAEDKPGGEA